MTIPSSLAVLSSLPHVNAASLLAYTGVGPNFHGIPLECIIFGFSVVLAMNLLNVKEMKIPAVPYGLGIAAADAFLGLLFDIAPILVLIELVVLFFVIKNALQCSVGRAFGALLLSFVFTVVCGFVLALILG